MSKSKAEIVDKWEKNAFHRIPDIQTAIHVASVRRTCAVVIEVMHKGNSIYFYRRELEPRQAHDLANDLLSKPSIFSIIVFDNGPKRIK